MFSVTPDDAGYRIKGDTLSWDELPKSVTIRASMDESASGEVPATATLTFDLDGGTLDGETGTITVVANVGDKISLPKAPTKDGYTFKYWKGSKYAAGATYTVKGDHAFTARWEKDAPATYTVTFDANGHGTAPAAQTVEDGQTVAKPADPKASGWTFGGWYTDKECAEAYDFSDPVTGDFTLYAKWTKDEKAAPKPEPTASKSESTASKGESIPRTGDGAGMLVVALSALALASLCIAAFGVRKRKARDV